MTKNRSSLFKVKKVTQSVTAPGDTNLSDATVVGGMSVTAVFVSPTDVGHSERIGQFFFVESCCEVFLIMVCLCVRLLRL